jgi:hypothetical protein
MTDSLPVCSNVYYLPVNHVVAEPRHMPRHPTSVAERAQRTWWRLRFMASEILSVLRRGGRQLLLDDEAMALDRWNDDSEPRGPRYTAPAQVIDFAAARERLRARTQA